jgi:hypothetical protein
MPIKREGLYPSKPFVIPTNYNSGLKICQMQAGMKNIKAKGSRYRVQGKEKN